MTERDKTTDRDEVLFAFHQSCDKPTAEQIVSWIQRYPQFAEDIRAHAAVAWDWAMSGSLRSPEVDPSLCAQGYSQALNIIYNEERSSASIDAAPSGRTFQQLLSATGKEVHHLARELDIDRGVLADLFNGWMLPPVCKRLADRVVGCLNTTSEEFNTAMQLALQHPRLGHAKADKTPAVIPRRCEAIIRESNMSPERKRYWLGED
jgi:hypothetical protein